jgi:hypothetical protein
MSESVSGLFIVSWKRNASTPVEMPARRALHAPADEFVAELVEPYLRFVEAERDDFAFALVLNLEEVFYPVARIDAVSLKPTVELVRSVVGYVRRPLLIVTFHKNQIPGIAAG